jgi:DnaJ domain
MPALPADLHALRKAYQTLGVPVEASAHAIKQAYRRRAKQWHPDRWPAGTDAQERAADQMRGLNAAYELIRHAPLRYHVESHPRVEARAERKGKPIVRESIPLTDRGEDVLRFVLGALLGGAVDVALVLGGVAVSTPMLVAIPVVLGLLSVTFGDAFWGFLMELLFWF